MSKPQRLNSAYGIDNPLPLIPQVPIVGKRNPNINDKMQIGTLWINTITNLTFILTSITGNSANWQELTQSSPSGMSWTNLGVVTDFTISPNSGYIFSSVGGNTIEFDASIPNVGDIINLVFLGDIDFGWTLNLGSYSVSYQGTTYTATLSSGDGGKASCQMVYAGDELWIVNGTNGGLISGS
jgi:hypothetical protein